MLTLKPCIRCKSYDALDSEGRCVSCQIRAAFAATAKPYYRVLTPRTPPKTLAFRRRLGAVVLTFSLSCWASFGMLPVFLDAIGAQRHTTLLTVQTQLALALGLFLFLLVGGWAGQAIFGRD